MGFFFHLAEGSSVFIFGSSRGPSQPESGFILFLPDKIYCKKKKKEKKERKKKSFF